MALIIEDGSDVTDSNSYISEVSLDAYADVRGIVIAGDGEALLIQAMDYLEELDFIGIKNADSQSLQWPRSSVVIDGFNQSTSLIPVQLIKAQAEVALAIDAGFNPLAVVDRETKSEKVGDIAVVYQDSASSKPTLTAANTMLKKITKGGSGIRVVRA